MTTLQRRQDRTVTQREPCRYYAIPLQLSYKVTSKLGPLYGFGQSKMISSTNIIFGSDHGLQPRMHAEIAVAWPRLLEGRIRLQLVLEAIITSSQDGVVEAHILAYDFRTCPLSEEVKKHVMGCKGCDDLLAAYKHSVGHYTKFLESIGGTLGDDSRLASIKAEELARECRETSDALTAHWRQDHGKLSHKAAASSSSAPASNA